MAHAFPALQVSFKKTIFNVFHACLIVNYALRLQPALNVFQDTLPILIEHNAYKVQSSANLAFIKSIKIVYSVLVAVQLAHLPPFVVLANQDLLSIPII